jgi:uncharacterized protein
METAATWHRGDWLQTYTGAAFYPLDPRAEDIRIADIASALSKMCRYGGHCVKFYSVAEHCVHVASMASDALKLTALMHDAAEAYLGDMVRPLKLQMPAYRDVEHRVEEVIAERFGLVWPFPPEIKRLDSAILEDERQQNMCAPPKAWTPRVPLGITLKFWTPAEASYQFTTAFYRYGGKA